MSCRGLSLREAIEYSALLYKVRDRKMHDNYLQHEPSHFKDFAFFLSKLHVKDLGETFKINVPDVILF